MCIMKEREFEDLLISYEGLFRVVLFKCHIYKNNSSYEDYLQRIKLLFFELTNQHHSIDEFKKSYPLGYLFQRLSWKVKDLQRIEKRQIDIRQRIILYYQEPAAHSIEAKVEEMNLFETAWHGATTEEKEFLLALLQERDIEFLARKYNVSSQTIRNKKSRLLKKYFLRK